MPPLCGNKKHCIYFFYLICINSYRPPDQSSGDILSLTKAESFIVVVGGAGRWWGGGGGRRWGGGGGRRC